VVPDDVEALKAALVVEHERRLAAEADAAAAKARLSDDEALIAHLKLQIEKLRRELFGARSERTARLLDQLELQLEELETTATEDELAAEQAAAKSKTTMVAAFARKRPSRKPFPEHLPRERVVIAAPTRCPCCGGSRLSKLGEDVTETLEVVPRQWKVIQTVREKFSSPPFSARRRAMRLHCGKVDEHLRRRAASLREPLEDADPDAVLRPSDEAVVERLSRPVVRRCVHPPPSRLQHMHDAADHPSVVDALLAARVRRQMRRDLRELLTRQPELVSIHRRLPFGSRESQPAAHANTFMGPDPKMRCSSRISIAR
jgi:hypothetical protein